MNHLPMKYDRIEKFAVVILIIIFTAINTIHVQEGDLRKEPPARVEENSRIIKGRERQEEKCSEEIIDGLGCQSDTGIYDKSKSSINVIYLLMQRISLSVIQSKHYIGEQMLLCILPCFPLLRRYHSNQKEKPRLSLSFS